MRDHLVGDDMRAGDIRECAFEAVASHDKDIAALVLRLVLEEYKYAVVAIGSPDAPGVEDSVSIVSQFVAEERVESDDTNLIRRRVAEVDESALKETDAVV